MTKPLQSDVMLWLTDLAKGRPEFNGKSVKETYAELRPIAASLRNGYDAMAFREASRQAVAATLKWWREADIRERLDTWVKINLTVTVAWPPEVEGALVSQQARHWLAGFYRAGDEAGQVRVLDLIRGKSEEAYSWLLRHEPRAAEIAVWRHWTGPRTPQDLRDEWDDLAGIQSLAKRIRALPRDTCLQATLQDICLTSFTHQVASYAPQHFEAMKQAFRIEPQAPVPVAFPAPESVAISIGLFE